MRKWWKALLLVVLAGVAALGLGRVHFETDPLAVLPSSMPEVEGLRAFQEAFSRDEELVILLESGEPGELPERAEELAGMLEEAELGESIRWRPRWREDPESLASLFAWLWLNGEPETLEALESRLSADRVDGTLEASLQRVATSMGGGEMMLSAHDPFGFLGHPSMESFLESAQGGNGLESPDGMAHLLLVDSPEPLAGYEEAGAWLAEVRALAGPWAEEHGLEVGLTGDPAFEAEIGGAMEGDMSGTLGITSLLIGALFLVTQRRVSLLAGLGVVLGLVFVTALGLAGWIYGELSIMAAGFAAILVGLAVDYGVLICQEAKMAGHDERRIRDATAGSIVAASLTTAAVFLALNFSGLPGIAQLGSIVGLGVLAGAAFMLVMYLPWVARMGAGRPAIAHKPALLPNRPGAIVLLLALVAAGGLVLGFLGLPGVMFERDLLRPKQSRAMDAFERIQAHFPEWGSPALRLIVEGGTDEEVRQRAGEARTRLERLRENRPDLIEDVRLPLGWWPAPERIGENRATLGNLAEDRERLLAAADEVGFSEEGVALDRRILDAIPEVLELPVGAMPDGPAAGDMLRAVMSRDAGGGGSLLGSVEVGDVKEFSAGQLDALREVGGDGIHLAGWPLLKPAVLPLVRRDLTHVFLPMAGLMLVMLSLVFRNVRDVLIGVLAMGLSGLLLLAAMRVAGFQWNFLNIAATPLLLGTGLDYIIHILLSLRRNRGNLREVWNGTGKAVLFCGCSTAIGFGSLCFASIEALASLGRVAVTGILISMLVSVVLVPALCAKRVSGTDETGE